MCELTAPSLRGICLTILFKPRSSSVSFTIAMYSCRFSYTINITVDYGLCAGCFILKNIRYSFCLLQEREKCFAFSLLKLYDKSHHHIQQLHQQRKLAVLHHFTLFFNSVDSFFTTILENNFKKRVALLQNEQQIIHVIQAI
jgi:hypothetical protein